TAQQTCSIGIGDSSVHLVIHQEKGRSIHFLNLHDNENTAVEAALQVMKEKGGRLTELRHTGQRLVKFSIGNQGYQFDPNRMFTEGGRSATLKRYGRSDAQAEAALQEFADSVLGVYGIAGVPFIVTLHNNSEEDYSAKSYLPGAIYAGEARKAYLEPGKDADDFVIVTRRKFYRFYKRRGINVILQSKSPSDDGSLSVYAEWNNIPYINIEAQEGHTEEQREMIEATYDLKT
ncbi:MAG TPA: hypothetical protein VD772_10515, partial [Anseongella sp.]|nr:hypothetical protein [Anseongella sp.]